MTITLHTINIYVSEINAFRSFKLVQSAIKSLNLCTGALHYVPYSFSLFSNTFCFSRILDFSTCIIFHICTCADMKYYAHVL